MMLGLVVTLLTAQVDVGPPPPLPSWVQDRMPSVGIPVRRAAYAQVQNLGPEFLRRWWAQARAAMARANVSDLELRCWFEARLQLAFSTLLAIATGNDLWATWEELLRQSQVRARRDGCGPPDGPVGRRLIELERQSSPSIPDDYFGRSVSWRDAARAYIHYVLPVPRSAKEASRAVLLFGAVTCFGAVLTSTAAPTLAEAVPAVIK